MVTAIEQLLPLA